MTNAASCPARPTRTLLTMELRRVLRGPEPEIEAMVNSATGTLDASFQACRMVSPVFPAKPGSIHYIRAFDVIEHVHDEESWLFALVDLLEPGGELQIRVPAEGPVAWLDALNIYRYVTEFFSRGKAPRETKPSGWHRHYTKDELVRLVERSGLRVGDISRVSPPVADIPHLAALVTGDLVRGDRSTEFRFLAHRDRLDRRDPKRTLGPLGSRYRISATKP